MTATMKSSQDSCEKMEKQARLVQDQLRQVNNKHAVEEAVQAAIKAETRRNRPQYSSSLPPPHTIEEAIQSAIQEELRRNRPAPQYSLFTPLQGSAPPQPTSPWSFGYPSASPPAPPQPTSPWPSGGPNWAAPPPPSAPWNQSPSPWSFGGFQPTGQSAPPQQAAQSSTPEHQSTSPWTFGRFQQAAHSSTPEPQSTSPWTFGRFQPAEPSAPRQQSWQFLFGGSK